MNDQFGNNDNKNRDYNRDRGNVGTMERSSVTHPTIDSRDSHTGMTDRDSIRSDKDKVLVGIFETESETINVVRQLTEIGYREDEITVVAKSKEQMDRIDDASDVSTKTHGDTGSSVGTGAVIGGTLGGLAAALPALGLLAIPGVGPFLAAGPIAAILGGVVAGGVAGGLVGGLVEMGVREDEAKEYEHLIEQGKILVLVENKENYRDDVFTTYKSNNSMVNRYWER